MMMVVFGAGASYDSVPARRPSNYGRDVLLERPPLATELFLDRGLFADSLRNFPRCNPVIPYLRSVPVGDTFEHVLERCENSWGAVSMGITNYVTMLDQLRRCRRTEEPVLLVSFNYDRLIEQSLASVGITIADIPNYVQNESFKLFKLHGSVHWGREVETTIPNVNELNAWGLARVLIDRADELKVSSRYRISNELPLGKSDEKPLFPSLAIPVETKRDFECPANHLACLCEHLGKVSKILIIGWRATEGHFLKLLKEHLPDGIHVQAVAGKAAAEEALAQIRSAGIKFVGSAQDGGFSEYVISRGAERFFRSVSET